MTCENLSGFWIWIVAVSLLSVPVRARADLPYSLAVYYVVPADIAEEPVVGNRIAESVRTVQSWYAGATGGLTWRVATSSVVRVYRAERSRNEYATKGWWESLPEEMQNRGYPIWQPGYVTVLWVRGAGWWAGSAQSCGGNCGLVLLGGELFPEFNVKEWSGKDCPGDGRQAVWPCTPEGALAHELGHTLGLPHPETPHSVMQTHWNFPEPINETEAPWGFLLRERRAVTRSRFMHGGVRVTPPLCDCMNLAGEVDPNLSGCVNIAQCCPSVECVTITLCGKRYDLRRGESVQVPVPNPRTELNLWECPPPGCQWSQYQICPGFRYQLVESSEGFGLKLVE